MEKMGGSIYIRGGVINRNDTVVIQVIEYPHLNDEGLSLESCRQSDLFHVVLIIYKVLQSVENALRKTTKHVKLPSSLTGLQHVHFRI